MCVITDSEKFSCERPQRTTCGFRVDVSKEPSKYLVPPLAEEHSCCHRLFLDLSSSNHMVGMSSLTMFLNDLRTCAVS